MRPQNSSIDICRHGNGRFALRHDSGWRTIDTEPVPVGAFEAQPHTGHSGPEYAAGDRSRTGRSDPHEVIASSDGKTAYVSIYGGGRYHALSVIDLVGQKALPDIDTGALNGPHGLAFVGGKVWFTAEGAKAIARYDPAAAKDRLDHGHRTEPDAHDLRRPR